MVTRTSILPLLRLYQTQAAWSRVRAARSNWFPADATGMGSVLTSLVIGTDLTMTRVVRPLIQRWACATHGLPVRGLNTIRFLAAKTCCRTYHRRFAPIAATGTRKPWLTHMLNMRTSMPSSAAA